jgi:RNA polymerase sigma factor (sigma-70 family)
MSDEIKLLKAALGGDTTAFEQIVYKYQSLVCAITFSGTGRLDISEDLAQETFLRAWRELFQLKELEKFRPWLCSIARNLLRNYYRTTPVDKTVSCDANTMDQMVSTKTANPSEQIISQEEEMILSQALMQIPEEYREPLVLYYRQQQSTKKVAESLDLNEATVRTRLSRGRQMLKDQVATMVERTLEKTGPSKKFTKAVMVSIGAGLAAGTAATAGMAAAGASVSTTVTTTGLLTAASAKVAAIAAAVLLAAGAVIYSYQNSQENTPNPLPIQQQSLTEITPQTESLATTAVKQEEIKPQSPAQQPLVKPVLNEIKTKSQPEKQKVRHPDWPGINEPVKYIYQETKTIDINSKEKTEKFWARLPDAFRDEGLFNKITIDNGKQRLVLDPNSKQAQIEPTWFKNGKMIWQYHQPLDDHPAVKMAAVLRDPNSNPEITLTKLTTESDDTTTVYDIQYNEISAPKGIQMKLWADNRTLLPEKIQAIVTGEPNQFDNITGGLMQYNFSPVSDNIFSVAIPAGYNALPAKQPKGFRGHVVDVLGNPVAQAEVYLDCWAFGSRNPYTAVSDINGYFDVILPQNENGLNYTASLWAILPDNPDFIAWTLLRCPQDLEYDPVLGGTVPGNPGITYPSENYRVVTTDTGTMTYGHWCTSASDIILVMETGTTISGFVGDISQKPVRDAIIDVNIDNLTDPIGNQISSIRNTPPAGVLRTLTNQQGYYEIHNFPKLWKGCDMIIHVTPAAGQDLTADEIRIEITDPNQPIETDFVLLPQGPTVRGIVVDNYGTPLAERYMYVQVNGNKFPGYQTKTDANGRFELKHCPADITLQIKAELSRNSMAPHESDKYNSYVYYPDVTVDVGYQPGQEEYEVKLVAIKPEIEIEAVLTDLAGNPLPYFPVEIRAESSPIQPEWSMARNFNKRTDENGHIRFINVPEMEGLQLVCSVAVAHHRESKEMLQNLEQVDQDYRNNYYLWTEALVPLVPGQKKYQITVTIPTQEEYKQQKAAQEK